MAKLLVSPEVFNSIFGLSLSIEGAEWDSATGTIALEFRSAEFGDRQVMAISYSHICEEQVWVRTELEIPHYSVKVPAS